MKKLLILPILLLSWLFMLNGCTKSLEVAQWDKVTVSYDSFLQDWKIIDSAKELSFIIWMSQTFPAFDNELTGMKIWETKEFTATAEQWYGIYHENNKVQEINPTVFTKIWTEPKVWGTISLGENKGLVLEVSPIWVTIDFNEAYTREEVSFIVKILDIQR